MKTLFALLLLLLSPLAYAEDSMNPGTDPFWNDLRVLIQENAVQPIERLPSGRNRIHPLKSVNPEALEVSPSGKTVTFRLNEESFQAVLMESVDSDGGDLYDLYITDSEGEQIAEIKNFPAFGDILLALAGTHEGFKQVPYPVTSISN